MKQVGKKAPLNKETIIITPDDTNKVAELFYKYNALLDIYSVLSANTEQSKELLEEIIETKKLLEWAKESVLIKYTNLNNIFNYRYDFLNNSIIIERKFNEVDRDTTE